MHLILSKKNCEQLFLYQGYFAIHRPVLEKIRENAVLDHIIINIFHNIGAIL